MIFVKGSKFIVSNLLQFHKNAFPIDVIFDNGVKFILFISLFFISQFKCVRFFNSLTKSKLLINR